MLAEKRCGLPPTTRVLSCCEAGRDEFWLHRYLLAQGIENRVVDSSSIEVNRRVRHAKTDLLDVGKLVTMLARYDGGEKKVWSAVHVPNVNQATFDATPSVRRPAYEIRQPIQLCSLLRLYECLRNLFERLVRYPLFDRLNLFIVEAILCFQYDLTGAILCFLRAGWVIQNIV